MSERNPYSRVYWTVRDDERLQTIYHDDHHWAAWNRLLVTADMAWPASAELPASARKASVKALADAGVIELLPGGLYRFHGLDAERGRRSEAARASIAHRWNNERNTTVERPNNERSTRRDETRLDETSTPARAREGLPSITPEVAAAWETATGRSLLASGDFACRTVDDLCERQGAAAVLEAIPRSRARFEKVPSPQQLAADLRNRMEPLPKGTPEEVPAFRPAPKRPAPPPVDAAERQRILREMTGKVGA